MGERWEDGGRLQGVMLKAGSCEFGLSQDDFSKGRERAKGIAKRLRDFGGAIVEEPGERWDAYGFTAQDPDGFKITITRAKE